MVHRIQNRNPGYSDFSSIGPGTSFNFSNNSSNPVSHGANALKLENEMTANSMMQQSIKEDVNNANNQYHEELLKNQEVENIVENTSNDNEMSFTEEMTRNNEQSQDETKIDHDLSEFGVIQMNSRFIQ